MALFVVQTIQFQSVEVDDRHCRLASNSNRLRVAHRGVAQPRVGPWPVVAVAVHVLTLFRLTHDTQRFHTFIFKNESCF